MDITIEEYVHQVHWPFCWPLFKGYVEEVCGWDHLDALLSVSTEAGLPMVSTGLEQWIVGLPHAFKVVRKNQSNNFLGFAAYTYPYKDNNKHIWFECLYITPSMRYNRLTRALLSSFPGIDKVTFALHKSRRKSNPPPIITGLVNKRLVGDDPRNPHLEIWEFDISDHAPGDNPKGSQFHKKIREVKI